MHPNIKVVFNTALTYFFFFKKTYTSSHSWFCKRSMQLSGHCCTILPSSGELVVQHITAGVKGTLCCTCDSGVNKCYITLLLFTIVVFTVCSVQTKIRYNFIDSERGIMF